MRPLLILILGLFLTACRLASPSVPTLISTSGPTGISGQVVDASGAPATTAYVYAYRNPRDGLRGPADFEVAVGADGHYFLDLVEGSYHLVARQRSSGADAGPPRVGDAWAIYPRNPVVVTQDHTSRVDLVIRGISPSLRLKQGSLTGGDTGFTGRLIDSTGAPLAGAFALAYTTPDHRRMPDYTSPQVGADGRFTLFVPQAGRYCLAARTQKRGQPSAGEPFGVLADGEEGCRVLKSGEILEVGEIILTPYRR